MASILRILRAPNKKHQIHSINWLYFLLRSARCEDINFNAFLCADKIDWLSSLLRILGAPIKSINIHSIDWLSSLLRSAVKTSILGADNKIDWLSVPEFCQPTLKRSAFIHWLLLRFAIFRYRHARLLITSSTKSDLRQNVGRAQAPAKWGSMLGSPTKYGISCINLRMSAFISFLDLRSIHMQ